MIADNFGIDNSIVIGQADHVDTPWRKQCAKIIVGAGSSGQVGIINSTHSVSQLFRDIDFPVSSQSYGPADIHSDKSPGGNDRCRGGKAEIELFDAGVDTC